MRSQIRTLAIAAALSTSVLLSGAVPFANAAILDTNDTAVTTQAKSWRDCIPGYVWREARPTDYVCVVPATRERTRIENSQASSRWDSSGAYGPYSCKNGYVWREAFDGDAVCVTPNIRAQAKHDNATEADHRVYLSQ